MTNQVLTVKEVAKYLGVSVATVWNMCNPKSRHYRPYFPKPFKVSANATRWLGQDVENYVQQLANQSKQGAST